MKFIVSILLIALLSLVAGFYLPWWTIAIAAFLVAVLIPQKPGLAFLAGFAALFVLWGSLAWYISGNNDHLLAHKVAVLLFKADNPALLITITAFIGALVAGFAALTGSLTRKAIWRKTSTHMGDFQHSTT